MLKKWQTGLYLTVTLILCLSLNASLFAQNENAESHVSDKLSSNDRDNLQAAEMIARLNAYDNEIEQALIDYLPTSQHISKLKNRKAQYLETIGSTLNSILIKKQQKLNLLQKEMRPSAQPVKELAYQVQIIGPYVMNWRYVCIIKQAESLYKHDHWFDALALAALIEHYEPNHPVIKKIRSNNLDLLSSRKMRQMAKKSLGYNIRCVGDFGSPERRRKYYPKRDEMSDKIYAYCRIANMQIEIGDLSGATETVSKAKPAERWMTANSNLRLYHYYHIGAIVAKLGRIKEAKEIIANIKLSENYKDEAKDKIYSEIANTQARQGHFEDAFSTCAKITDDYDLYYSYQHIAEQQAKYGMFDDAIDTAKKIKRLYHRDDALQKISERLTTVSELTEHKLFHRADYVTQLINKPHIRCSSFCAVARGLAGEGEKEPARHMIKKASDLIDDIDEQSDKMYAIGSIAGAQAFMGDIDQALETAKLNTYAYDRTLLFCNLAEIIAEAGDSSNTKKLFDLAIKTSQAFNTPKLKFNVYIKIAHIATLLGSMHKAEKYLDLAEPLVSSLDKDRNYQYHIALAEGFFLIGDIYNSRSHYSSAESSADDYDAKKGWDNMTGINITKRQFLFESTVNKTLDIRSKLLLDELGLSLDIQ